MSFIDKIHLYYEKITELFPKIIEVYPENAKRIIFLGDLFYAYVIQNNIDLSVIHITVELLTDYNLFYYKMKTLNMDQELFSEEEKCYRSKINSIMNTYNEYFINRHKTTIEETIAQQTRTNFVFDFSRFGFLKEIILSDVLIHSILRMPNTVKLLHITNCMIKQIDRFPLFAEYINCEYNHLTQLPDMHMNTALRIFVCSNNQLVRLPKLPDSIHRLFCSHNALTILNAHMPKQLKILSCNHNQITKLGELPSLLNVLSCSHNHIKDLSPIMQLHHLNVLYCNNNHIEELPAMPNSIQELNHKENPIQNYFPYPSSIRIL